MSRIHLIEIHEQRWCPAPIRDGATDFLRFFVSVSNPYSRLAERLLSAIRSTDCKQVIDLCSGGGGPWPKLVERLGSENRFRVLLTDAFPNRRDFQLADHRLRYHPTSVDAQNVPKNLRGFRTLFASFHHFRPAGATAILRDAVTQGEGIAVFELGSRHWSNILGVFLLPVAHCLTAPWQSPFRWSRLLWTYLLPAIPLVLLFDGVVSCLRTYSPAELDHLIEDAGGSDYEWQTGQVRMGILALKVTYLIGVPRRPLPTSGSAARAATD